MDREGPQRRPRLPGLRSGLALGWEAVPCRWWEVEQEEALDFQASASCQPLEKGMGRHLSHKAVS